MWQMQVKFPFDLCNMERAVRPRAEFHTHAPALPHIVVSAALI